MFGFAFLAFPAFLLLSWFFFVLFEAALHADVEHYCRLRRGERELLKLESASAGAVLVRRVHFCDEHGREEGQERNVV